MHELVGTKSRAVFTEVLPGAASPVVVCAHDRAALAAFVMTLRIEADDLGTDEPVRLLVTPEAARVWNGRSRDYGVAIQLAELVEHDRVEIAETEETPVGKAATPTHTALLEGTDETVSAVWGEGEGEIHEQLLSVFADAEPTTVGYPSVSQITTELSERFEPDVASSFEASLETARSDATTPDAVKLLLWLGGRFELPVSRLRRLVEDLGIASQGTVSRRLSELTDAEVLFVIPTHEGQGHPVQKLHLAIDDPGDRIPDTLFHLLCS